MAQGHISLSHTRVSQEQGGLSLNGGRDVEATGSL
jgi:hypothetical protein